MRKIRITKTHLKHMRRMVALVLIVALFGQTVSTRFLSTAYAAGTENLATENTSTENIATEESISTELIDTNVPVTVVGEVESLRNEKEKHFRMSDGSFMAVSYGMAVHYEDENGEWQDIDNRMILSADQSQYLTENLQTAAAFASTLNTGSLFETIVGDTSVGMTLMDTSQANAIMSARQEELELAVERLESQLAAGQWTAAQAAGEAVESSSAAAIAAVQKEISRLENLISQSALLTYDRTVIADTTVDVSGALGMSSAGGTGLTGGTADSVGDSESGWNAADLLPANIQDSILYEDVFPGVDLLYTKYSHHVKEQIIVKTPKDSYRYDFELALDGVEAVLNENGSVSLINEADVELYHIPAPFMEDDKGAVSYDAEYILTPTAGGVILSVVADAAWMNAEERAYPVAIDPTIQVMAAAVKEDIFFAYTAQGFPDTFYGGASRSYIGYSGYNNIGECRGFLRVETLPEIPDGMMMTDASISLYMDEYSHVNLSEMGIGIYEVTDTKPASASDYYYWVCRLTWNTNPAYNTLNMIDYTTVSASNVNTYYKWDLTELAKKWYSGEEEERTIALTRVPGVDYTSNYAFVRFYAFSASYGPIFTVSYRDTTGIEPYYTYQTLDAGNAGTAYIADATGQVKVVKNILSYASTVNPFSLNLVYNSDYFSQDVSTDCQPPTVMGSGNITMKLGAGWTLDIIQTVKLQTIGGVEYLCYQDGDGTAHYFVKDTVKDSTGTYYYDEDGLGLKVKAVTAGYEMSDDHGNTWTFTSGRLTGTKDSDGNCYTVNYDSSGKITTIVQTNNGQTSITVATFEYEGNYVSIITDAAGNETAFVYSDSGTQLEGLNQNDVQIADYAYGTGGNRLVWLGDVLDQNEWNFQYTSGKCSMFYEYDYDLEGDNNYGPEAYITYQGSSQTVYQDAGNDRMANTSDDLYTTCLFDYAGRTVNVYTKDAAGNVIGASNAAYTGTASTDKTNNRIVKTASTGAATVNLLQNGGFEDTVYPWTITNAERASTEARTGLYALKGTPTSVSTVASATKTLTLTAGTTYTLSAYVKTSDATLIGGRGVYLSAGGASGAAYSSAFTLKNMINYATSEDVDDGWVRIQLVFTPNATETYTVGVYAGNMTGTFYVDDIQLEKGETAGSVNLLENGQMNISGYGWTTGGSYSLSGGIMTVTSYPSVAGAVAQTVPIYLPGTQTYVLSGWVKANAVPDNLDKVSDPAQDLYKQCGLRAQITYTSGAEEYHYVPFDTDLSDVWQYVSCAIVPKQPTATVKTIKVTLAYERNANTACFDDIALIRETAQSMTYDADGNLISASTTGIKADTNTYTDNKLTGVATGGNGTYTYSYGNTTYPFRVTAMTDGVITQNMNYGSAGNVISTTITGNTSPDSPSITGYSIYTNSSNLLYVSGDALGNETYYIYSGSLNKTYGLPSSVVNPKNITTTFEYDTMGRTTKTVVAGTAQAGYTYSGNQLSRILRTDSDGSTQSYNFTYDGFENLTGIAVGSRTLASYQYGDANGLLEKMTYGNGDYITYTYDILGRVIKETYSDGRTVNYVYDKEGRLDQITGDYVSRTDYTYDSLGRLIGSYGVNLNVQTLYTYDENSRLTRRDYSALGYDTDSWGNWYETYTYNSTTTDSISDGTLTGMRMNSGSNILLGYDYLQRLTTKNIASKLVETYTYQDREAEEEGEETTTSTLVNGKKNTLAGTVKSNFTYTYDANGNILIATDSVSGKRTTYTYDSQNQLTKAVHSSGTTEVYTYDSAGNLLTFNNGTTSHSYTYGNSSWTDLLTAVDGVSLSYDTSGNPTTYYNGTTYTMTWQEGRRLTRVLVSGGDGYTYTYDSDGLRTSKESDSGDCVAYLISDGRIIGEEHYHVDDGFQFARRYIFDESGSVCGYSVGTTLDGSAWTDYYFIKNLQGDVLQIFRASDNAIVGEYTYDSWGNVLTATGAQALSNPFRYRGYYYDVETNLYYCNSRYYDPEVGRFINADNLVSTGQGLLGYNMFAYCRNNPVCRIDVAGTVDVRVPFDANNYDIIDEEPNTDSMGGGSNAVTQAEIPTGTSSGGSTVTVTYTPPTGGGGVSSTVNVGDISVTFGHGGRHINTQTYNIVDIERTIAMDVVTRPSATMNVEHVTISYAGRALNYGYYTRDPFTINIGTYFFEEILK